MKCSSLLMLGTVPPNYSTNNSPWEQGEISVKSSRSGIARSHLPKAVLLSISEWPTIRSEPASTACWRSGRCMADRLHIRTPGRRLIVVGAYSFCSRKILYRRTTLRLNAKRGSEQYQSTKSVMARSYVRWLLLDVRLFKTAAFDCSRSGRAKTRLGVRFFRRVFGIGRPP